MGRNTERWACAGSEGVFSADIVVWYMEKSVPNGELAAVREKELVVSVSLVPQLLADPGGTPNGLMQTPGGAPPLQV